ncbi:MAG: hypothetical protein V4684_12235 [Pseudomonadota bacterium]
MSTPTGQPKRRKDAPLTEKGDLYLPRDFHAGTDAVEKNTDSAWAQFQEAEQHAERRFADTTPTSTAPQELEVDRRYARTTAAELTLSTAPPTPAKPRGGAATVEVAMVEARRNNRVCPKPHQWQQLFDMLPDGPDGHPPPPLTGAAWASTPSLSKRMCLRQHLEWAALHGRLDTVLSFMRGLAETEWLHMDD